MAVGLIMTFDGMGQDEYEAAVGKDALDLRSPGNPDATDDWPDGVISHHAGPTPTGWAVVDVWESQEKFDAFLASRLGPAMAANGIPEPQTTPFEVYNSHH